MQEKIKKYSNFLSLSSLKSYFNTGFLLMYTYLHYLRFIGIGLLLSSCFWCSFALAFCGFFVSGANSNLYNDATQVVLNTILNSTPMITSPTA